MHDQPASKHLSIVCSSIQVKHALIPKYYQKLSPNIITINQYIHQLFDFLISDHKPMWISETEAQAILVTQLSADSQITLLTNRISMASGLISQLNQIIYSHPLNDLDHLKQLVHQEFTESNSRLVINFLDFCITKHMVNQSLSLLWLACQKPEVPVHLKNIQLCGTFDKDVLFLSLLPILQITARKYNEVPVANQHAHIISYDQPLSEIESVTQLVAEHANTQNRIAIITTGQTQAMQVAKMMQAHCLVKQNKDMLPFDHFQQNIMHYPLVRALYTSTIPLNQLSKNQLLWLVHTWHPNHHLKQAMHQWSNQCATQISAETWIKKYPGSDHKIQSFLQTLITWDQRYNSQHLQPSGWLKAWQTLWLDTYLWSPDSQLLDKEQNNIHQKLIGIFEYWSRIDQWIQPLSMEDASHWLKQLMKRSSLACTKNHPSRVNILGYQMIFAFPKQFFDNVYATTITWPASSANQMSDDSLDIIDTIDHMGGHIYFSDTEANFQVHQKVYNKLQSQSEITSPPHDPKQESEKKTIIVSDHLESNLCQDPSLKVTPYQLQMHLQCPLKAYLSFQAKLTETHEPIVEEVMIRGQSLHEILALFWTEVRTWQALHQSAHKSIEDLVKKITKQVVDKQAARQNRLAYFDPNAEMICLQARVNQWIDYELTRQPFKVVAIEASYQRQLNHLTVAGRVDRIDELANGSWLLIDYKLSKSSLVHCFPPHMTSCQLPVYRWLIHNEKLAGFGYGHLLLDKPSLLGVGDIQKIAWIKDIEKLASISWEEYGNLWQKRLNDLSQTLDRTMAPQPIPIHPQVCNMCPFHIQCPKQQGQPPC